LETVSPVILTTSQLLTTGVDIPTCKNIAIVRVVGAMTEFKQIIGRGTRVRDDYDKYFFNIIDYTGSATRHFADPDFDGYPAFLTEQEIDENGKVTSSEVIEPEESLDADGPEIVAAEAGEAGEIIEPPEVVHRKLYVDGGHVEIATHLVYELDSEGNKLRVIRYTDYTREKVRTLYASAANLRQKWADPRQRSDIIEALAERGIDFDQLAEVTGQTDADPFDLLCHVAYSAPLRTRRERATSLKTEQKAFLEQYGPEAKAILDELLEKYAEHGVAQFELPDILKVPPISNHGNVIEIAGYFGGPEKLSDAVRRLQALLYAA